MSELKLKTMASQNFTVPTWVNAEYRGCPIKISIADLNPDEVDQIVRMWTTALWDMRKHLSDVRASGFDIYKGANT